MTKVDSYFVANELGHLEEALAVARSPKAAPGGNGHPAGGSTARLSGVNPAAGLGRILVRTVPKEQECIDRASSPWRPQSPSR
jgi:hypothetical protein